MRASLQADAEAEVLLRESLALAYEIGDKATEALGARSLSLVLIDSERCTEAADLAETSWALYEQTGDRQGLAAALFALGWIARSQRDWEQAGRYYSDAVAMAKADRLLVGSGLLCLGYLAFARGAFGEARGYAERARAIGQELGDRSLTSGTLPDLGVMAAREGRTSEARSNFEQFVAVSEEIGSRANLAYGQARLGYMLALQGQLDAGWNRIMRALRFSRTGDYPLQTGDAVSCIGKASVDAGRLQRGAELLGLALRLKPASAHLELWLEPELSTLRAALGAEGLEAALARGAALDLHQVVAEILTCDTPEVYWGTAAKEAPAGSEEPEP